MLPPQFPGSLVTPENFSGSFQCPSCNVSVLYHRLLIDLQFKKGTVPCPKCATVLTPWQIALHSIKENFMGTHFYFVGAQRTIFQTKLFLNSETRFDLYAEGLPQDAIILDIHLSPQGGMFCTEMTGNTRRQRNRGGKLQLFGFHTYTIKDKGSDECTLAICVTWVPSSPDDIAWSNLVSAFDAYTDEDFEKSIIPANVAVEAKLYRFLERAFDGIASKDRTRDFLESAATYSYQLNILLPLFSRIGKFPELDPIIRGLLNNLRDTRNSIAHRGKSDPPLTKDRTAELLTAALFGFRYIDCLRYSFEASGYRAVTLP
jgi:hypothetical protein